MATKDKTFVKFNAEQAQQYATGRGFSYPPELYQAILDYHEGPHDLLLDVGTGPGKVVFDMLQSFKEAIGCDTSTGMVEQANKGAIQRGVDSQTRFVEAAGEKCDEAVSDTEKGKVDVIAIAMAAHWLDIEAFYAAAARTLRPGGTLAMWTCSSMYVHPSNPNAAEIQKAMNHLENDLLLPYHTPSNFLSRTGYDTLAMPWDLPSTTSLFSKDTFSRVEWDRGGVPSAPNNADGTPGPFLAHRETTLEALTAGLATASSVIRYRDDHPDKANTDDDPVILTMNKFKELLGGRDRFVVSPSVHLLLMRKL